MAHPHSYTYKLTKIEEFENSFSLMKMLTELFGKKWIQKNLQDFNLSCRFVYIYSKWDAAANRYIVPFFYLLLPAEIIKL